jgi:hypothetical protein
VAKSPSVLWAAALDCFKVSVEMELEEDLDWIAFFEKNNLGPNASDVSNYKLLFFYSSNIKTCGGAILFEPAIGTIYKIS